MRHSGLDGIVGATHRLSCWRSSNSGMVGGISMGSPLLREEQSSRDAVTPRSISIHSGSISTCSVHDHL